MLQSAGKNYLVDCGGSSNTGAADAVAAQLLSQGITQLDGIIITHYDVDHAGALVNLLTRIQAKALYLPPPDDSLTLDDEIAAMAPEAVRYVSQTMCIQEENLSLSIYAPEEQISRNESALCVLFQGENCDILITGDRSVSGERALLSQTQLPKVDILVAGHGEDQRVDSAAEFQVAAEADRHVVEPSRKGTDGEHVRQGLGGMLVAAVPAVDDRDP